MKCPYCKKEVKANESVCPKCKAALEQPKDKEPKKAKEETTEEK